MDKYTYRVTRSEEDGEYALEKSCRLKEEINKKRTDH